MNDTEVIEMLCKAQDLNKHVRLQATTERQVQETDRFEKSIQEKFKNLYLKPIRK